MMNNAAFVKALIMFLMHVSPVDTGTLCDNRGKCWVAGPEVTPGTECLTRQQSGVTIIMCSDRKGGVIPSAPVSAPKAVGGNV